MKNIKGKSDTHPQPAPEKPKSHLRIVDAEELTTPASDYRGRSRLVQQFVQFSNELDAEIERILKL